ncbi:protocatechuate 3,4-dioxygenase subunit alpha [Conyzicola nivalis]|uniref:Protocatechuate 3,4-dioxygenase subunit alpha n=1 Tax=Conyzicola nivalis TaxID=1477021 RepID=A0A916SIE6_9MICO|nr:protocatechuate 3,4-dioxygenase subunit alpha [Conyzicola nivalis]GGB01698.1 protocatechuate 3,4-dioxygenase subunit alpha [Conyzicola nivalis]
MNDFAPTPSQTVGPFFHFALPYDDGPRVAPAADPRAVRLHGTVFDGTGTGVRDAVIEIWQADDTGSPSRRRGSLVRDGFGFTGFGRAATNLAGEYSFTTLVPGTSFATVAIFARGLSHHLFTRAYFSDVDDALLGSLPADRRTTLVATADAERSYRFDIRLQGDGETVFLEYT